MAAIVERHEGAYSFTVEEEDLNEIVDYIVMEVRRMIYSRRDLKSRI